MANKIPSRLKTEKARGAKPYERPRQSLLHKVASTVRDILVPSWLLNASSSWKTTDSEVNEPTLKGSETSVQPSKETLNEPLPQNSRSSYIPAKRPRYSLAGTYNHDEQTSEIQLESWLLEPAMTRENANQPEPSNTGKEFNPNYPYTRKGLQSTVNGDDQSENSEGSASTSGCSSLVSSHQERQEPQQQERGGSLHLSEDALERIRNELRSKQILYDQKNKKDAAVETESDQDIDHALSRGHFSLWSESIDTKLKRSSKSQPVAHGQKPSFSLSSFGAPLLGHSTLKERSFESPFYEGSTMFGGASAYRRARLSALPYQTIRAPRSQMKVRETRVVGDTDCMSTTAKRILQTLEKMSTPLSDVKKIPTSSTSSLDLSLTFTPGNQSHRPSLRSLRMSGTLNASFKGPPVSNVTVPSPVIVTKNLEHGITSISEKKSSSLSKKLIEDVFESKITEETGTHLSDWDNSTKGGGKIRVRTHQSLHHSLKQKDEEREMVKELNLPNIALPISTLPKFTLGFPERNDKNSSVCIESSSSNTRSSPIFTFSLPIAHQAPGMQLSSVTQKSTSFTFSSPVVVKQDAISTSVAPEQMKLPTVVSLKSGVQQQVKKSEMKTEAEYDKSSGFSPKPANEIIIGGSVMDILGKPSEEKEVSTQNSSEPTSDIDSENSSEAYALDQEMPTSQNESFNLKEVIKGSSPKGFGETFRPAPGTWECSVCMIRNKESDDVCVACENSKSGTPPQKTSSQGFGDKFKPPAGNWECPTCMISNKAADMKCMACETTKPGTEKNEVINTLPGSWACPTCALNNNSSYLWCAACGASRPKPGPSVVTSTATTIEETTTGFGDKFRPSAGSWECDTCLVRNASDTSKCIACETPRSSSKVADVKQTFSGFKFGLPSGAMNNTTPSVEEFKFVSSTSEAPKPAVNFQFGGAVGNSTKSVEDFKFGASKSELSNEGFKFGAHLDSTSKPSDGFKFGNTCKSSFGVTPSTTGVFKFGLDTSDTTVIPAFKFGDNLTSKTVADSSTIATTTSSVSFPFGAHSGGNCQASGSFSVSMKPNQTLTTQSKAGCKVSAFETESEPLAKSTEMSPVSSSAVINSQTSTSTTATVTSSTPKFPFNFSSTVSKTSKPSVTSSSAIPTFSFTCPYPSSTLSENKTVTTTSTPAGTISGQASKTANAFPFSFGNKSEGTSSEGFTFKKSEDKGATSSQPSFGFFKTDTATFTTSSSSTTITTTSTLAATTSSTSIFKFGASSATTSGGNFVFGALKQDTEQGTTGTTPFSLNSGTPACSKPLTGTGFGSFAVRPPHPSTSQVPSFSFGSGSVSTVPYIPTSSTSETSSAPSFGTSNNVFRFSANTNSTSSTGGPTPAPVFGASGLNSNTTQPVFGGFSNVPSVTFGQTTQPKQEVSSGFSFGAPPQASATSTSVFRFGATEDQKLGDASQNSAFNFTFTPKGDGNTGFPVFNTPPTFNFSANSTPTGPSEFEAIVEGGTRRIRKAVRRCRTEAK